MSFLHVVVVVAVKTGLQHSSGQHTHTYAGIVAVSSAVFMNVDVGVSVCVCVDVNVDAGVVATLHGVAFAALCAVTSLICQQHATHQTPRQL